MKNRVALGTFPLASPFNSISRDDAKGLVRLFIDEGGYYIDTAPMYGFGEVEKLLGEALIDYPREDYYIATKCGYIDVEGKTFQNLQKSGKYDDVIRECERSLGRLKVDYIDLYFSHSPDPETPFEETMQAMIELQKQGKIKEIGVSNVNLEELKEYNKTGKVKYVQNRFSLINRSIDDEFEKYMNENDIKLVPYEVIERGQLTGKALQGFNDMRKEDLRIGRSDWESSRIEEVTKWVKEKIAPVANRLKITIGQLAIAWTLHQPFTGFSLIGGTNKSFVPINLKSNEVKLDSSVLSEIDSLYLDFENHIKKAYGQSIREFRGLNEKYY